MQLLINTNGSLLKKRGDRFVITAAGKEHQFSAQKLTSIVISTAVCLTSDAIQLAGENKIEIVFLDSSGYPASRVWQSRMGSTAKIRIAQLNASVQNTGLKIAVGWIIKKLTNQIGFLEELKQRRPASAESLATQIEQLHQSLSRVQAVELPADLTESEHDEICATVRGFEGTAGRTYFRSISDLLPERHRFPARSRRPAGDAFNAMLNYSYGVLYSHIERSLILAGLDPFIGFFHANRYGQPSLVFDMIEPFRIIGERTTTLMFTGKRVKDEFFREVPGGIELGPDGRAALVDALNKRLEKTVRYPVQKQSSKPGPAKTRNIRLRDTIGHEAHQLANLLLGRNDLPTVINSQELFMDST